MLDFTPAVSHTAHKIDEKSPFGIPYRFTLGGAAAVAAGDQPETEFLIHFPTLKSIAESFGLVR